MPLGDGELREDGRTGTPDLAAAPGIIEATIVAEGPAMPDVPDDPDVPDVVDLRTTPDIPHVPLWGPPSRGGAVALWEQSPPADGDGKDASVEPFPVASTTVEPAPLSPRVDEPRHRRIALVGVTLAGAALLLGAVAVTGWPGTKGTDSVANQLGPGGPGPNGRDGSPADLPPSQPATPVSFASSGEVVRPEPRRARIVDPRSGQEVIVDLPPGTRVDAASGQVVVRVTGTPTSIPTSTTRPSTTTTSESTTSTTEDTTTTTEDTTTTTEDTTTTTEDTTTTVETLP
jgi:hypothetical protein